MPLNIIKKYFGNKEPSDKGRGQAADADYKYTNPSGSALVPDPFAYTRLDPEVYGIRLLTLAPSPKPASDIHCFLEHVAFAQRPEYEAISYTWGSDVVKKRIFVNEKEFEVGNNLWSALVHLRQTEGRRVLWVDAICINQADIPERNHQVRLMPHIYNRAKMVNVWLGNRDRHADAKIDEAIRSDLALGRLRGRPYWGTELLEELCLRPYWNRVWIIQEIGKAQQIRLHYDGQSSSWEEFVAALKWAEKIIGTCVPLKLDKNLQEKYKEGYKLHSLLEGYQSALCKDPRDKIYGFVGLATDCDTKFPMDYSKSLFDIWMDVVRYRNSYQKAEQSNFIEFAQLVGNLLGLFNMPKPVELAQKEEVMDNTTPLSKTCTLNANDSNVIKIPVIISGTIAHLGPTYEDIVGVPNTVDSWESEIANHCPEEHLPNAYEESDLFLHFMMGGLPNEDLEKIQLFNPTLEFHSKFSDLVRTEILTEAAGNDSYQSFSKPGPRLFLLDPGDLGFRPEAAIIGLAPSMAQPGDLVCHLYNSERAIIARQCGNIVKLVGTAVLALDCESARSAKNKGWKSQRFSVPVKVFLHKDAPKICIDISTLFSWIVLGK